MKKTSIVFGLLVASFSSVAFAGWSPAAVALSGVEADSSTTPANGTLTYLQFATTPVGKPTCGTDPQGLVVGSADNVRAITSLATAAYLSGKTVRVRFTGTCTGTISNVDSLLLQ